MLITSLIKERRIFEFSFEDILIIIGSKQTLQVLCVMCDFASQAF